MKRLIFAVLVLTLAVSLFSCGNEEIVGYDPEIPQEWIDAQEEQMKMTTTEVIRTNDFSGIWQNEITGEYYHIFEGGIYKVERPDATEEEVEIWGSATMVQVVDKADAEKYITSINPLEPDEEFEVFHSAHIDKEPVEKMIILENGRTKVITESGREITFKFIKEVTDGPAGYEVTTEFDY